MYCSKCGTQNNENAKFCSHCGRSMHDKKSSKTTWLIIGIILSVLTITGVGIGIFHLLSEQGKVKEVTEQSSVQENTAAINETEKEKTQIIKESMPKVFTVLTAEGQGSGFLYKDGGYIVTNAHVVAGYTDVIIKNHAGQESPAQVIGISDQSDIALLHANDYAKSEPFPIKMEQSIVGTEVIAIGSPQGFENSASIGYLTGTDRDIEYDFIYEELYQIDAQIDQGSSGGPLLDAKSGNVIGINSLLYTNNNSFGFSIPLYTVTDIIDGWIASPMNKTQIASIFGAYDEFVYSDPSVTEEVYSEEEYSDYWDQYYEEYSYEDNYTSDYTDENVDDYWEDYANTFDEESLSNFILSFRDYYELALYYEDFYWIQDMLYPDSTAYLELEEYVYDITGQGFEFYFTSNTITGIEMVDDYAIVSTNEEFDFYNANGEYTYYNKNKEYTVIITEDGYYQITDIFIYD